MRFHTLCAREDFSSWMLNVAIRINYRVINPLHHAEFGITTSPAIKIFRYIAYYITIYNPEDHLVCSQAQPTVHCVSLSPFPDIKVSFHCRRSCLIDKAMTLFGQCGTGTSLFHIPSDRYISPVTRLSDRSLHSAVDVISTRYIVIVAPHIITISL